MATLKYLFNYKFRASAKGEEGGLNCGSFRYGATAMQGWRKNQEDTYRCLPDLIKGYNYFAVFDGHGGSEVAKYLEKYLHKDVATFLSKEKDPELALQLGFLSCDASLREPSGIQELNDIVEAENMITAANIEKTRKAILYNDFEMRDGAGCSKDSFSCTSADSVENVVSNSDNHEDFETMSVDETVNSSENDNESNKDFTEDQHEGKMDLDQREGKMDTLKYLLNDDLENSDSEDEDFDVEDEESSSDSGNEDTFEYAENLEPGIHSGSTGTVLLMDMDTKQYYCANVGDSRCVLCRGGKAIDLSIDHKPDDPDEMKRIKATGSIVSDGRINKNLNLSRAFGDFYYKNVSLAPFEQCVTVEPSIMSLPVQNDDEFIVIASDGIWNSMSSQEVVDFVSLRLKKEENLRVIIEELFRLIIAPDTSGDGTGCDNMTCIVIKLDPSKFGCDYASDNISPEEQTCSNCVESEDITEK